MLQQAPGSGQDTRELPEGSNSQHTRAEVLPSLGRAARVRAAALTRGSFKMKTVHTHTHPTEQGLSTLCLALSIHAFHLMI